jgi:hypothetical protein
LRRAEISRAHAALALIDTPITDTVAVSPVDGGFWKAEVGEVLAAGTTVVTIDAITRVRAYVNETRRPASTPTGKITRFVSAKSIRAA